MIEASNIFLSYRREDTSSMAGRIYDRMIKVFVEERVFMDVSTLEPGVNFVELIDKYLEKSIVVLAIIGPDWLSVKDDKGQLRLDNPEDFVRVEIASALRQDITLIPVLTDGAKMPSAEELPDDLKKLAERNAIAIRHERFDDDINALIRSVAKYAALPVETQEKKVTPSIRRYIAIFVLLLLGTPVFLFSTSVLLNIDGDRAQTKVRKDIAREVDYRTRSLAIEVKNRLTELDTLLDAKKTTLQHRWELELFSRKLPAVWRPFFSYGVANEIYSGSITMFGSSGPGPRLRPGQYQQDSVPTLLIKYHAAKDAIVDEKTKNTIKAIAKRFPDAQRSPFRGFRFLVYESGGLNWNGKTTYGVEMKQVRHSLTSLFTDICHIRRFVAKDLSDMIGDPCEGMKINFD